MKPKISIVVPVYNVERFLVDCIESIRKQTLRDFELILVNDGSTDQSGDICDQYAKKDERIIVIHKENGGQSSARNRGIDEAKGEFIGFIDSDDWIQEDMYEQLYIKAKEEEAEIAACNIIEFQKDNSKRYFCLDSSDRLYDRKSAMNELYLNERLSFSPCNKIYKRTLFDGIRFKEGYILEDVDFAYRIIHQSARIYYTGQALYNYRYNEKSTLRKEFSKKRLDEYEVRRDMYLFYLKHYPEFANEVYAEWFLTGLMLYINVEKYFQHEKEQYKYLLDFDRKLLKPLIMNGNYNKKKRVLLTMAYLSPALLVTFYRYYWDRLKKAL